MSDQDVQLLLADLALIIVLARLLGAAARRIGQPPVLGEIVAGILLGPTLFSGHITTALFPAALRPPLTAIADLGLVLFMFVVGYEVDLALVRGRERIAAAVSLASIALPLVLGSVLGIWLAHRHHVHDVGTFAFFIGVSMSVTAFPVLARILTDRGMHRTRIGGLALASASVDDVLAWCLLAIVVAVAGVGGQQWRLALAPVYAAVMIWLVRPALRWLSASYKRQARLTPNVLAAVLAGLLASAYFTDWMGVKFIFGAFIFGMVMPRDDTALRQDILERLEQVSVLVLLPVFFVVSGLSVNLSGIGLSGLLELVLILIVAIAGKFGGAYAGGRTSGLRARQAGALATLMNTRGLTGIVILAVGLQLGILGKPLYSLMVVMCIITTAMAGPLLNVIYPDQVMRRDIAEADRAALGEVAAHRVVVLIDRPDTAQPLIDVAARLAAAKPNSEVVLCHLVAHQPGSRLEVGSGLGGELLRMTQTMDVLRAMAAKVTEGGVRSVVLSRFSDDVAAELPGYLAAAAPDTIVLHPGASAAGLTADRLAGPELTAAGTIQLVGVARPIPAAPPAAAVAWARGPSAAAAIQVAAQLAVGSGIELVLTPAGRAASAFAADLAKRGIPARAGGSPAGAILVAPAGADPVPDGEQAHVLVQAGSNEASDDLDQWAQALDPARLGGGHQPEQPESSVAGRERQT